MLAPIRGVTPTMAYLSVRVEKDDGSSQMERSNSMDLEEKYESVLETHPVAEVPSG
jgi:hypothetical protein